MILREKPHNPPPPSFAWNRWRALIWLIPVWAMLLAYLFLATHFGEKLMGCLAAYDPDADLRARLEGLRTTRALTLPHAESGPALWRARGPEAAGAGFFIAGAVRAERLGRPEEARAFLALELLGRGDRAGAEKILVGTGLALPTSVRTQDPATWEELAIGQKLKESLEK